MKKIVCDKCGEEIIGSSKPYFVEFKIKKIEKHLNFPSAESKIHLCRVCSAKLDAWLDKRDSK